jgi:hypothetical protein
MLVEFQTHPDGGKVTIDTNEVRAVVAARGDLPFALIRLTSGEDVVVRGTKSEVANRLELTEDWRGTSGS